MDEAIRKILSIGDTSTLIPGEDLVPATRSPANNENRIPGTLNAVFTRFLCIFCFQLLEPNPPKPTVSD